MEKEERDTDSHFHQLLLLLTRMPEEEREKVAEKLLRQVRLDNLPAIDAPTENESRYSQTVLDAIKNHKGPSLMKFLLENRLELPDDIDFSRPSGGAREDIVFD